MRCAAARSIVSDYIDGELDARTADQLEEHLRSCPNCPTLYAALVVVRARLASLSREAAGDGREIAERVRLILDM